MRAWGLAVLAMLCAFGARADTAQPMATAPVPVSPQAAAASPSSLYIVRYDRWSEADEKAYGQFITAIGESGCHTVNQCLHIPQNPYRGTDPPGVEFRSDCADLPYVLRAYFAWKRGLPFSYESAVEPRGHTRDIRYTPSGNEVVERRDVLTGSVSGYELLDEIRDAVSSASYRIHPDLDGPQVPDLYSPAIDPRSIRPGTMVYDPNGHVATIYRIDPDGRLQYIDAHPDSTVSHGFYDERFVRARPGMGAGFKNWRPMRLVGYTRRTDGVLVGGHVELARNKDIPDFSDVQFFGTGPRPDSDSDWADGSFALNGEYMDYYDWVRAKLAGGRLEFDPVKEVRDMVDSNCDDLHYRYDAVVLSLQAGLQNRAEPERLPANIYGTEGDWEEFSTPSRDARLKTAFKELRDQAQRFVKMYQAGDAKLVYKGHDLVGDLLATFDREAGACHLTYQRTDGSPVALGYEDMRRRLFLMSFDPYQCVERRWGATDPRELATCPDGAVKQAWYAAEQNLRNQLDRTYDAEMDFTLDELRTPGPGKGVAIPPDIDVRAYLLSVRGAQPKQAARN
ncbi:MAG TPA: hypothetical protein VMH86_02495 [Rhizomicrobium sp.]|nr:hypothetical protein [Rhizomicrobium sp.]